MIINKVNSTLDANISTTVTYGETSTFTYTLNPTGTVTCKTGSNDVATCSVDSTNKKITITPVNIGTTKITINGTPSNSNYNSSNVSKTITVKCSNTATEPSTVTGLVYNGSSQIGLKGGSNVNLSTTSAVNAGSYTGKATPKANYCWSDGTTTTKSYTWSIAKKDVACSISSVPTLKYPGSTSGTLKYSCTDSKTPSVTSSDTSAITVSNVTSTTASLNALKIGSSTISVYTASDSNYNASNKATTNITTSASTYTLTYNNNGGSGCSSSTMTYGSTYGTMCEPSRSGYIFIGWFDSKYKTNSLNYYADTYSDLYAAFGYDQDALYNHYLSYGKSEGRRISQYISTDTYNTSGNQTIYAGWYPKSYTISYNSNGGSGTMSSDTVKSGGSVTIKANTFTRTGYRFLGWTTNSDGTDDGYGWTGWGGTWAYDNGQYGISNNSLVLYARWQQNKVTIKLNPNGGTVTANTSKGGTYAINSAGNITKNGSDVFHTIKYGNSLGSSGLANYNNENYLYINKDNYYAFPATAWICKSGCTTANKVFDQEKVYKSTDFCDASSNDCTVVLEVNWMQKDVINGYRCHFGDNGVYYISFCSNDGKSAEESSDQCIYTERFYSDSSGSHSDYTSGVIMRNTLNGYSCYTDTINGNRCNDNGTYYITTCSEVDCNYTKFNGANETGLVVRNSLKANCGTPEHTHVWKARGIRKFSIGQSTKFSCGSYHASGLAVYCSVCGMSKDYYNANIAHVSEKFLCPDNPYGSPNGWKILDDCSITTRNELKNISGGTNMFSETTSNSC